MKNKRRKKKEEGKDGERGKIKNKGGTKQFRQIYILISINLQDNILLLMKRVYGPAGDLKPRVITD